MEQEKINYYSPTRINCYLKCPRLFYYRYVLNIQTDPSIHLYKGSLVHNIIENVFKNQSYKPIRKEMIKLLKDNWNPKEEQVVLSKTEDKKHFKDAMNILSSFGYMFEMKMNTLMQDEKIKDKQHAWNTLKPTFSEFKITDDSLQLKGIIDAIDTDWEGRTFIIDYKTSHKFKDLVPEEYLRQIRIYALLYSRYHKKNPDYVGINYIRYGETYLIPVTVELINKAKEEVEFVKSKTQSNNIEDYPLEGDKYSVAECKQIEKRLKTNG